MNIKIVIAAHKEYFMPDDPVYLPIHAGSSQAAVTLPYLRDDAGKNISGKNPHFCELTCLYWAWQNLDADYIGLVHYRRHFRGKNSRIISGSEVEEILQKFPVILPRKRNYFIESNHSQYIHAHHAADLEAVKQVIAEKFPEYLPAYRKVMKRTTGYRFNMCIMRKDILDKYCQWLFEVLFETEKILDISGYDSYDARVFGFLGERLLDIYIEHHQPPLTTLPVTNLESQHWGRKIISFLLRKFTNGKYRCR